MLLFLDTEYTGLGQSQPKLISLALVAEDGSREFYVELDDTWIVDDCTGFVQREVLPLLNGPRAARVEACTELREWLTSVPRAVTVACDSETDWRFLLGLLGLERPRNLSNHYYDLRPLIDTPVYDRAVQAYYRGDDRMHHALADARAYRCGWLAWMDAKKTALPPDLAAWESAEPVGRELGAITTPPTTILVVDLEATCDENVPSFEMEAIEMGAVWIAADGAVLDRFQSFVRPVVNPTLTPFCKQLTGITQADVDAAPLFPVAADELRAFVAKHQQAGSVFMSWGSWDSRQLQRDSARHSVAMPIALPHQNAKALFAKKRRIGKQVGMAKACELVGLALAGTHHRALDDALNVARLLPWVRG
ncbi:exonuclease domain-containing protein [Burkholderia vietnamiensis]|uniref:exonuclease domain-containing protein n=1 Tax=Burkholderia vietnamiensis TaxID=60552 RepID=UPI003132E033